MRYRVDPKHAGAPWVDELLRKIQGRTPPPPELTKQQRSLVKLACASIRLHAAALAKDAVPRDDKTGASKPLALANAALATVMKGTTNG
jgi:hypothetical protein